MKEDDEIAVPMTPVPVPILTVPVGLAPPPFVTFLLVVEKTSEDAEVRTLILELEVELAIDEEDEDGTESPGHV